MRYFYDVWVRSSRYHGKEALTYSSSEPLAIGSIVEVELQTQAVLGFIMTAATTPRFQTKPILRVLALPPLPSPSLRLARWLASYYPAPLGTITQQFLPNSLPDTTPLVTEETEPRVSLQSQKLPPLTEEQIIALTAMQAVDTYLLHGTTGSGKTRLYIELTKQALAEERSAIILTPEISLTAQLVENFRFVFGDLVILLHSQQTPKERRLAWLSVSQASRPCVIIGPRSALFSPIRRLGLIVLDEVHEAAYKQEQAPAYQTSRVAAYLAQLSHAKLILGSATPLVSDYYIAIQKQKPIIELRHLAQPVKHPPTEITLVDMRERNLFTRSSLISQPLLAAIDTALTNGEQSLLYLNRRGTAKLTLCENCGWQATCPHCDVPLTYHSDYHQLRCHSCNYHLTMPTSCPTCGHPSILFKAAGTKAIVEEIKRLFTQARVARYDTDNTKHERFEKNYTSIRNGEVDILVGTQLLAKGIDLPKLSTLGVILADTSLSIPDYTAEERSFQLLSQVLGRVGRGHRQGQAIIQTYHPDHPVIIAALSQDYSSFYNKEIINRRTYYFPPFCYLLKLVCRRSSAKNAENTAMKLKSTLLERHKHIFIEGPAPAFHERIQGKFAWQLIVKSAQRSKLVDIVADLPTQWSYDLDPVDLL